MDALTLLAGLLLPWWLGIALLLILRPAAQPLGEPGEVAWTLGAGYFVGAFALTVWMRALSLAGVTFGVAAIGLPLLAVALAATIVAMRRSPGETGTAVRGALRALIDPQLPSAAARFAWWLLLAWLAVRFALLATELASRPLYPWDAWTQWATKARVWYELGHLVPFARGDAWLAANGAVYFDASPEYPPTMPLLQVWSCIALGRWDDTLMNGPWWQVAAALLLAVYGALRSLNVSSLVALVGAFFVASLPLANVHVALAGYADLPMAAWYTTAALAFLRWNQRRSWRTATLAIVLAIGCTQIKNPGWFWAATLLPGVIVAMLPRYGVRIALIGFGVAAVALVAFARFKISLFNYQINLDFNPAWGDLGQSYFLLGNWNLLWYGAIAAAALAWRQLFAPLLAPLTTIMIAGLLFLFFVFGFTTASFFITDQTTVNRATLHLAPLAVVFMVVAWHAFARRWRATHETAGPPTLTANVVS